MQEKWPQEDTTGVTEEVKQNKGREPIFKITIQVNFLGKWGKTEVYFLKMAIVFPGNWTEITKPETKPIKSIHWNSWKKKKKLLVWLNELGKLETK